MGIRVHKIVGYALTDVQYEKYNITDERIDPLGYLCADCEEQEDIWTLDGFLTYLENYSKDTAFQASWLRRAQEERRVQGVRKLTGLYELVSWDSEFGEGNVLCIQDPWMYPTYTRYDDTIDWHEETQFHKQRNRVVPLEINPYPHSWEYRLLQDGLPITLDFDQKRILEFFMRVECDAKDGDIVSNNCVRGYIDLQNSLAKKLGYKNLDEVRFNVIPYIPDTVAALCKYLLLFNDEETIWTLKPIIYIYWG